MRCTWEHADCFAVAEKTKNKPHKECTVLIETDFPGRRDCPFYKSKEKREQELIEIKARGIYKP